jgi:hypothetical protein
MRVLVYCEDHSLYRLNMCNAETGERIGTLNTRPRETWSMLDEERERFVAMFCELANEMHWPTTFIPTRGPSMTTDTEQGE